MLQSILTALLLSFDFETGYVPHNVSLLYYSVEEMSYTNYKEVFYISLNPRAEWKFLYVDLDFSYFAMPSKGDINFTPFRGSWSGEYGIKYQAKNIGFTLGYANGCSHSIVPFDIQAKSKYIDLNYNKVFARVSMRILNQK